MWSRTTSKHRTKVAPKVYDFEHLNDTLSSLFSLWPLAQMIHFHLTLRVSELTSQADWSFTSATKTLKSLQTQTLACPLLTEVLWNFNLSATTQWHTERTGWHLRETCSTQQYTAYIYSTASIVYIITIFHGDLLIHALGIKILAV